MNEETSEFGKGLTYCLGLFLAHAERKEYVLMGKIDVSLWFNGAGDHLFEMDTSNVTDASLKDRLDTFRDKVLDWRMCIDGQEIGLTEKRWAIEEAKELLRLIDKHHGIKTIEADYK